MKKEIQTEHPMDQILSVRVPVYVHQQVHTIAGRQQQTVSDYMRNVLKNQLKRQKT
jgi:predicted HicB family RNase H-like nuclease